ncbi:hypothetical protein [Segeticoccus rhizosphaerae]|uniref:hypothetical protein n=1 Tax=Segeticoccus rhizosphaerae TaxID=1104777 RepID=UPI0010BF915A|nr:hypothetical protein [Ornithinicoccus soli]
MTDDIFERFVALAERWDLVALRQELAEAIGRLEGPERPYVPTNLAAAIGMLLDSYGPPGVRWSEEE